MLQATSMSSNTTTIRPPLRHCITIDTDVYNTLKQRGKFGETFNDVIRELLNIAEKQSKGRSK